MSGESVYMRSCHSITSEGTSLVPEGSLDVISIVTKQNFSKTQSTFIQIWEVAQYKWINFRIELTHYYFIIKNDYFSWINTKIMNSLPLFFLIVSSLFYRFGLFFPYRRVGWILDTS